MARHGRRVPQAIVCDIFVPIARFDVRRRAKGAADRATDSHENTEGDLDDNAEPEIDAMDDDGVPSALRRLFVEIQPGNDSHDGNDDPKESPEKRLGRPETIL
jgi:hypothetical protein